MSAIFFRAALFTTILACSGALAGSVLANGNHHSAPLGGRSALMGGTGIALGLDGAAPFLNPATIARIEEGSTVVTEAATGAAIATSYHSALNAYSWELVAHLGATYRLSDPVTLGLSVRTPAVHLASGADYGTFTSFDDGAGEERIALGEGSYVARPPPSIGVGVGAETGQVRVEVDAFFHAGQSEYARIEIDRNTVGVTGGVVSANSRDDLVLSDDVSAVLNGGAGVEWFVARDLSLLAGIETDVNALSERKRATIDQRMFRSRLDVFAAALGMAYYGQRGDVLVGLRGDYGTGEIAVVNPFVQPSRLEIADQHEWGVMLILAGRLSLKNLGRAADRVDDALAGTAPKPAPKPREPLQRAPE